MPRKDYQGADPLNPVDVPMAGNARESVKNSIVNSETTYGVRGKPENFGISEARNIREADRYAGEGYDVPGVNVAGVKKRSK